MAYAHPGYWIDVGTPEKYLQVHRDILSRRFPVSITGDGRAGGHVHPTARIDAGAHLEGPFYVGPGCRIAAGASLGPFGVLVADASLAAGARAADCVLWAGVSLGEQAAVEGALLGSGVKVGRHAVVGPGACLGEGTVVTDHSRTR
jgi:mannose-1-phosphate guanylyltransferase